VIKIEKIIIEVEVKVVTKIKEKIKKIIKENHRLQLKKMNESKKKLSIVSQNHHPHRFLINQNNHPDLQKIVDLIKNEYHRQDQNLAPNLQDRCLKIPNKKIKLIKKEICKILEDIVPVEVIVNKDNNKKEKYNKKVEVVEVDPIPGLVNLKMIIKNQKIIMKIRAKIKKKISE